MTTTLQKKLLFPIFLSLPLVLASCGTEKEETQYTIESQSGTVVMTGTVTSGSDVGQTLLAYVEQISGVGERLSSTGMAALKEGDAIAVSDTLRTGVDSEMSIVFQDHSVVRMGPDTVLRFTKLDTESQKASLEKGEVWTRVLRPFTDGGFFQIDTSDVSAGVRGSSVYVRKDTGSGSEVIMLDSGEGQAGNRTVQINYPGGQSGDTLTPGQMLSLGQSREKKPVDIAKIYRQNPRIRSYTRKDIIFMRRILKKVYQTNMTGAVSSGSLLSVEKVRREIGETLPQRGTEEVTAFFLDTGVRDRVIRDPADPEVMMRRVFQEEVIQDIGKRYPQNTPDEKKKLDLIIRGVLDDRNTAQILSLMDGGQSPTGASGSGVAGSDRSMLDASLETLTLTVKPEETPSPLPVRTTLPPKKTTTSPVAPIAPSLTPEMKTVEPVPVQTVSPTPAPKPTVSGEL